MYTFRWVFEEVLCHSFNFVNMRFVAKVIFFGYLFFSIKFYRNIYFHGKFITEFCFFFFFTLAYVPLDEQIRFYRKKFSPSFNKTGKLQVLALYL